MPYHYAVTQDTHWQTQADWQTPDTPFMTFAYWQALNDTGAIGERAGWLPLYVLVYANKEQTIGADVETMLQAVMPVFIKGHHRGEYVFDHAWAEAYARYGVDYYPRLVTSVPYTPVSGQRIWLSQGVTLTQEIWQMLLAGVDDIASQIDASSWHGLFATEALASIALVDRVVPNSTQSVAANLTVTNTLERQGCQFIWHNHNLSNDGKAYTDFEDFLSVLTARKRKNIRQERKKIAKQQLTCRIKTGTTIEESDWQTFYRCYAMTYAVRGQQPYLNDAFFKQLADTMPERLMLAQALSHDDMNLDGESERIVASSLFFYDDATQPNATLYGRYWGSLSAYDSLHFELCYYQGIEFAIAQGLQYFDPGTQGEHKLIRGFAPYKTHSLHRIYDARFRPAIEAFCQQDCQYMQDYRQQAHEALPFNADNMPKFLG